MDEGHDPFAKLKEQVTCPVCLDVFTQPKLLACTHAFCMDCINHLPVDLVDGENKIQCPTCREPTTLPRRGSTASLRPAFLINTLIELHHTAVKLPVAVTDKPKDNKCLKHDRSLEMYCDDCKQIQCAKCFSTDHRDHNCDFISDIIDKHRQEINDQLLPVTKQLSLVLDALHDLDTQQEHIATHAESVKSQIDALIDQLVQAIHQSGAKLKQNVNTLVQHKLNNISQKKEEGEMLSKLLKSCEQYVQDKLRNGSQQEILLEKNEMMERLRAVSQQLTLQQLQLKEKANIVFQHSGDVLEICGKIGEVSIESVVTNITPSGTTDKATNAYSSQYKSRMKLARNAVAIVGRPTNVDINVPNVNRLRRNILSCHLVADVGGAFTQCEIKHVEKEKYRVSFTAAHQGLYHIKVQIKGAYIPCDPCTIHAVPIIAAECTFFPAAIAATGSGLFAVCGGTSIAVMDKRGHVIHSSSSKGGGENTGICITPDNYIVVASSEAPHITKYTMDCTLVSSANTSQGNGPLRFYLPQSIAVSTSGHLYVCDTANQYIQVLNPDLTFSHMFGERGSGPGQFKHPCGIVIDSQDAIYVCDDLNHKVQKLSNNGTYIREFKAQHPQSIAIHYDILYIITRDDIVVYTTDGEVINNRLTLPDGKLSNREVTVDQEHVYVFDRNSKKIIVL